MVAGVAASPSFDEAPKAEDLPFVSVVDVVRNHRVTGRVDDGQSDPDDHHRDGHDEKSLEGGSEHRHGGSGPPSVGANAKRTYAPPATASPTGRR